MAGKIAYFITTSGMGSSNKAINTMKTAFATWGLKCVGEDKFRTGALMETEEIKRKFEGKTIHAAEKIITAVKEDSGNRPSFYSLMSFKVQLSYWLKNVTKKDSIDYKYWSSNGWLSDDIKYYIPHKASGAKTILARLVGGTVATFFIKMSNCSLKF